MAEIERTTRALLIDATLPTELAKLSQEGWLVAPECVPVAVYHLARTKAQPMSEMQIEATMTIDESKVGIIRGDKFIKADGTEIPLFEMPKGEQ